MSKYKKIKEMLCSDVDELNPIGCNFVLFFLIFWPLVLNTGFNVFYFFLILISYFILTSYPICLIVKSMHLKKLIKERKVLWLTEWIANYNPSLSEKDRVKQLIRNCFDYVLIHIPQKQSSYFNADLSWLQPTFKGDYILFIIELKGQNVIVSIITTTNKYSRNYSTESINAKISAALFSVQWDLEKLIDGFSYQKTEHFKDLETEITIPDIKSILNKNISHPLVAEFKKIFGSKFNTISKESITANYISEFSSSYSYHVTTEGLFKVSLPKTDSYTFKVTDKLKKKVLLVDQDYLKSWLLDEDVIDPPWYDEAPVPQEYEFIISNFDYDEWCIIWNILKEKDKSLPIGEYFYTKNQLGHITFHNTSSEAITEKCWKLVYTVPFIGESFLFSEYV